MTMIGQRAGVSDLEGVLEELDRWHRRDLLAGPVAGTDRAHRVGRTRTGGHIVRTWIVSSFEDVPLPPRPVPGITARWNLAAVLGAELSERS